MKKISILNYGSANYSSIVGALKKFNCQISITNDIKILDKQDIIILPGVGTFPKAIDILKDNLEICNTNDKCVKTNLGKYIEEIYF